MVENESNKLVKGVLLLTIAGFVSKVLSAGYRIPLQNLTGDVGFYIYQQVYPILGIAMMLSLYGFPSAISRIIVELKAKGKAISFSSFFVPIFTILIIINGALFLFFMLHASTIANRVGDMHLVNTYRYAAFVFLIIPFLALLRGIFQGNYVMKPTAYSQVGEQLVRVFIIIAAAIVVTARDKSLYDLGNAATFASIAGGIAAIIVLSIFFIKDKPILLANQKEVIPWKDYILTIATLGIVATLNHMTLLIIQLADTFTFMQGLMEHGFSKVQSMEAKGVFDRGQPLIQLGIVLGSSLALALIPSISKQKLEEDWETFNQYISNALTFSFYIAIGATVGLIAIFEETNILLYEDSKGTMDLRILVLSIILCSLAITASSVLQGLGYIKRTAGFIIVAFFIKWILNELLIPMWGMTGAAIATVLSLLGLVTFVMLELKRKLPSLHFFQQINWLALLKATVIMLFYIGLLHVLLPDIVRLSRMELLGYVLFTASSGAIIYLFSLLRSGAFTEKELEVLPYSSFLIRIHKGRKLNGKN
ncbi:putative polysaccharide biosynthesis protein [Oceanobacillus bengalensis]|uniref:Polysaccharide biosynthesis protein n=1 Tax=Oceanobacillus bengalensis TaxID=1435466 RepID=A0A494YU98_9BACI|nr:polysaccharide biosynthesis protein [Oceanobacillus bengalensis]RKQ13722.1 polysaccharide biosynthesis protein [Oceanobacillus bengalensis]